MTHASLGAAVGLCSAALLLCLPAGESSSTPGAGPVLETTLSLRKDGQPQHAGGAAGGPLQPQWHEDTPMGATQLG